MKIAKSSFYKTVENLNEIKLLVVGDAVLDEYLFGEVTRISPEAPVPVVLVKEDKITLGGAGNVIKNLSAIGVKSQFYAKCGKDLKADKLKSLLHEEGLGIHDLHLTESDQIPTILKTRVIASHQQICRIDREKVIPLSLTEEKKILASYTKSLEECNGVILSDYDKGYFNEKLITQLIQLAKKKKKFIAVDPQVRHFFLYKGISIMTPNHHEAGGALGRKLITDEEVAKATIEIAKKLSTESMMITRGEKGMTLYSSKTKKVYHIPTVAKEVYDVTGAGDTVISLYSAFRTAGMSDLESTLVANAGAGVVVEKLGASTVNLDELEKALIDRKLLE
ncbi:MAG TPA: D-glycero-beta-D-manno-heptose-7-phosphate kinase [Leptospiraceae bacterium]|nr:D-glycero-beta-D-manno-heptose-7-phosphate kinase [Leptospiraceae bacterium]HMW05669.1 D-glycero-beta-D-manno-heptose-7-phosphate kinase [Leptospiraceae bacterium]HMX34838.1 D-glycero-beta-D-manno-heptose-7-phosphate kinase [Leptospiraceae bacterium]HMY30298.1 D-glycero-beta-D-manno-heptose-7-phosphate kinase [Leptospiraceae bacterium]HMZ63651.1 D-glycero-beta-D-manno-heptose-7-phosphate kinase [Leptospiraceae bacterium]